jgi:plasmid stabilization system protein ParE
MALPLIIRPEAQLDIENSAVWYERQQAGLGSRFVDGLNEVLTRIAENPIQFPQLEKGVRRALLRRFPYGLYFVPEPNRVVVLAVLHLRRHPDTWKRRT